jgi:hypothetical protein
LPWNFNCLFTSRYDNYFVISGHILQGKVFIKVQINCQSPIEWAYYASSIGKPNVCCYCAAEGIQQDNEEVLSCPAFVSSLSEGQKANTKTTSYQKLTKHELDVA